MLFPRSFPQFRWSPRLHWPWLAALALLCFSLSMYLLELPALRAQNEGLAQQIHILETQLRVPQKAALHDPSLDLNKQLASFDRLTIIVKDLHTLATQNGLNLSEASYKLMDDGAGSISADTDDIGRIEIQARLSGNYVPLKSTIANLLAAHDGLALESLSLRRNRSTDLAMEIDLRLSFFTGSSHEIEATAGFVAGHADEHCPSRMNGLA